MRNLIMKISIILVLSFILCIGGVFISKADELNTTSEETAGVTVSEGGSSTTEDNSKDSKGVGMIAAALAIGLASIGSGIAVAVVASSAVGAISENPSLLGKAVIFAGLAEGIAIYGLIIAIMILSKV